MDTKVVLERDWVLFDMVDQETLDMAVFDTWGMWENEHTRAHAAK
jgi:hypothetical protein